MNGLIVKLGKTRGLLASLFFVAPALLAACSGSNDERLFSMGENLRKAGRYQEAVEKYSELIIHHKQSELAPLAFYRTGEIDYLYLRDFTGAVDNLRSLLVKYPWSEKCRPAQKMLAEIYMNELHEYKKAIIEYQKAISIYGVESPEAEEFQYEIAKAYFHQKEYAQQRVELGLFLKRSPESSRKIDVYYQIAGSYYTEGILDKATQAFLKLIEDFPDTPTSPEASFQLAVTYEEKGELMKALERFRSIEKLYPNPEIVTYRIDRIKKRIEKRRR